MKDISVVDKVMNWEESLRSIISTYMNSEKVQYYIKSIKKNIVQEGGGEARNEARNEVLIPTYVTPYVISFFLMDCENEILFDCSVDLKSGVGYNIEKVKLNEEQVQLIQNTVWPTFDKHARREVWKSSLYKHVQEKQ